MRLTEGTTIYTADGDKAGEIDRFVLDPGARSITHVIVSKGFIFETERVIPVDDIETSDDDRATLRADIDDPSTYPEFDQTVYVTPDDEEVQDRFALEYQFPLYYYPYPLSTGSTTSAYTTPTLAEPRPTMALEIDNVPDNMVAVKEDANVISLDGDKIGEVEEVFIDPDTELVSHFAVSTGFIFKEKKLIPTNWVETVTEDEVFLNVGNKTLEKLADFEVES